MSFISRFTVVLMLLFLCFYSGFLGGCGGDSYSGSPGGPPVNSSSTVIEISGALPAVLTAASPVFAPNARRYAISVSDAGYRVMIVDKSEKEIGTAVFESGNSYRASIGTDDYDTYIMLIVRENKSGKILFRNILGRLPVFNSKEAPDLKSVDKIKVIGVPINDITTARALLAMEKGIVDGMKLPFFTLETGEIQSDKTATKYFTDYKTPFDDTVDMYSGGESNVKEIANAVSTVNGVLISPAVVETVKEIIAPHAIVKASDLLAAFTRALNEIAAMRVITAENLPIEINIKTGTDTVEANILTITINQKNSITDIFEKDVINIKPVRQVETPVFSVSGGVYKAAFETVITCATPGAIIKYTTDGSDPSSENGFIYSAPVKVERCLMLKAIAFKNKMYNSYAAVEQYYLDIAGPEIAPPLFSLHEGIYTSPRPLRIYCSTYGATIKYTLDGSTPSLVNGIVYKEPLRLSSSVVVKAMAIKDTVFSPPASASFIINPNAIVVSRPYFKLNSSEGSVKKISILCSDAAAKILYTLDGSEPSHINGIEYSGPISIERTITIKAVACCQGFANSEAAKQTFVVKASADYHM